MQVFGEKKVKRLADSEGAFLRHKVSHSRVSHA